MKRQTLTTAAAVVSTVFALVVSASAALAACSVASITMKDAGGTTQTFCIGGGVGAYINQYSTG